MRKLVLFFILSLAVHAALSQRIHEPYDYPIKPGTEEWVNLKDPLERYEACQIPPDILSNLETRALIQSCLGFPFFLDVHAYDNLQIGFQNVYKRFNGLQELYKRDDIGTNLIHIYREMTEEGMDSWSEDQQGRFSLVLGYLELTIAQDAIVEKLTQNEITLLRQVAVRQFENKHRRTDVFGGNSLNITAWLLTKLLKADGREALLLKTSTQEDLDTYYSTARFKDTHLLHDIYQASKDL